jgi:hemerythrin-like metal-binding protein
MLIWSDYFETKIELVDTQHQRLCELLNKLADRFTIGVPSEDEVTQALQELMDYANQHFTDEEALMKEHNIDSRHFALHHMEHNSFIYDLSRLQLHSNVDENAVQTAERLVRFITSWLAYHILGIDQLMAAQIFAIEAGVTPEDAYIANKTLNRDAATTQLILDAVLGLWHSTAEHCRILEEKLLLQSQNTNNH